MSFGDDLRRDVEQIFGTHWTERDGRLVPKSEDLRLGNDAVKLNATVLYADLSASTRLVDQHSNYFAAEIYKAYLHCAAKIVRNEGGAITSYDGDRIMAVYIGDRKNSSATRTGLKLNYAVKNIVNAALKTQYPSENYRVMQTVGIDTSQLFVARTGVRGSNDLVWVGRAANHAAKLTNLSSKYPTWITSEVFSKLSDQTKYSDGTLMWEARRWTAMDDRSIYRSSYMWKV